jgi:hypothetical protein
MMELSKTIAVLCLLILPGSLIALLFRNLRPKAKWAAAASGIGLVVSFMSYEPRNPCEIGICENELYSHAPKIGTADQADQDARERGFESAADLRVAEQAGVSDADDWRQKKAAALASPGKDDPCLIARC